MNITYKFDLTPETDAIIALYENAGLNRPTGDKARIHKMYAHSNLVISAWDGDLLVGIARSLSDFCHCCYLSDLAVSAAYQKEGIGKRLIDLTKEKIGDESMLLLLSAPAAMDYYPKVGLEKVQNGFIIHRKR
jgi:ribosomal protein S18 acetylase RimI-like enzyme